jgi:hypothetical protein
LFLVGWILLSLFPTGRHLHFPLQIRIVENMQRSTNYPLQQGEVLLCVFMMAEKIRHLQPAS